MARAVFVLALLAAAGGAGASSLEANPIRKVVSMLQMMQNKVIAEGKKAEGLYDQFMCYCSTGEATLTKSISDAGAKITQLESDIKESAAMKAQLEADVEKAKADRVEANNAMDAANAQRGKEKTAFDKESSDLKANIGALSGAIPAIEKGLTGGFLQTSAASVLRKLSVQMDMSSVDRDMLASFLSMGSSAGYVPQSGEILGILKQMKDEMEADLKKAEENEAGAVASFEELMAAKKAEIDSLSQAIENKLTRLADTGVELAQQKNDLEDTREALGEDQKFLADMGVTCKTKQGEWDEYKKTQAEELAALADTIKFLNDDDALELFKKTLPGASSFLQAKVSAVAVRKQALAALAGVGRDRRLDLLEMALRGQKGFDKVIKLIDDLVATLHKEQADDDKKKEYCLAEFDTAEDKVKASNKNIADLEKAIADEEASIATTKSEIEALEDSIKALDKSVEEATNLRKEEHDAYVEDLTAATTAKDLLGFAKNRLNKFYNPKLYRPPPKRELSEEERITLNMGGTLAPTNPPAGIAGTGVGLAEVSVHNHAAPPPPPEANLAYKKKEGNSGPIAMIDILVKDLDKQIQEMEVSEKDAQGDYEKFMKDSADERADSSKSLTDKEGSKAALEDELISNQEALKNANYDLMDTEKYIAELHGECDWNLKFHDVRKEARAKEIEALGNAKDVLKGADYSL